MSLGVPISIKKNEFIWDVTIDAEKIYRAYSVDREDAIVHWLDTTFGEGGWGAPQPDIFAGPEWVFSFRTEHDALMFKLRFA